MKKHATRTAIMFVIAAAVLATGIEVSAGSQAPATSRSIRQGVYTEQQAKRGEPLYKENCASCHGDQLAGSGPMPALKGKEFDEAWKDKTVWDLFEKTHTSMPASAPGSLTEQQTADILAHMFSVEKYPAGATELATTMELLAQIRIEPPTR